MPELPPAEMIRAVVQLVASQLPHLLPDVLEVRIHSLTRHERVMTVLIPREKTLVPLAMPAPDATPPPQTRARGPVLNDMERDIMQAVSEAAEEMTGEQIAKRAGYEPEAFFRQTLAGLRRRGLLTGEPGARGYRAAVPQTG